MEVDDNDTGQEDDFEPVCKENREGGRPGRNMTSGVGLVGGYIIPA